MICFRCNGKGGYEQRGGYLTDEFDTNWDLCPECNGKGKLEEENTNESKN